MAGGPSHLETFDYKPKLAEMHGQPMPESFTKGQPIAQLQGQKLNCFGPQHPFVRCGKSGQEISSIFPHLGRSGRRDVHHPLAAHRRHQSRSGPHVHEHRHDDLRPAVDGRVADLRAGKRRGRPARLRGDDLAGQVRPGAADRRPACGTAAFCPAVSKGSSFAPRATRCLSGQSRRRRPRRGRRTWSRPSRRSTARPIRSVDDPEIATRISQYEMAFRMQASVPRA